MSSNPPSTTAINSVLQQAWNRLTNGEQKLLLLLANQLDPAGYESTQSVLALSDIEQVLAIPETNDRILFFQQLEALLDGITSKRISFPVGVSLEGMRLRGYLHWVSGAVPMYNDNGILCVTFDMAPQVRPFLLALQEKDHQGNFLEIAKMKAAFSAQLYRLCLTHAGQKGRTGHNMLTISIEELRGQLNLTDKYLDFRNFRRKVLDVAKAEINEHTRLHIDYDLVKIGRNVASLRIVINQKDNHPPTEPRLGQGKKSKPLPIILPVAALLPEERIDQLTEAQRRAFHSLTGFGLPDYLALDAVLPLATGSELVGYEDFFITLLLGHFEKKAKPQSQSERLATFVKWLENRLFDDPNTRAKLLEQVVARKKKLTDEERTNRERAKSISAAKFRQMLEAERKATPPPDQNVPPKTTVSRRTNRVGEGSATSDKEIASAVPAFHFETFKMEHPSVYQQICQERKAAFAAYRSAPNYERMLENSIRAYCEQWIKRNV